MLHQYKMNDMNIVLDVNSGAVHVVDDIVYDIIEIIKNDSKDNIEKKLNGKYTSNEIKEAVLEIENLEKNGQLFTKDEYKEIISEFKNRDTVVKALCLHIAHDCNLACKYCFAEEGEYRGDRSMMSYEVGKKAIDFLIKSSGNRRNLEIDFFGGEPLMNFDVVKQIVEYAKSIEKTYNKNFRFTITTNGVLLDEEKIDYINKTMHNVVLSIDGRKEVHDNMRPSSNNKGSYDLIFPKFKELVKKRDNKNYYVRGTYTHFNKDFSEDVLHLVNLGFDEISVEPVVAPEKMDYALKQEDIIELKEEYDKLVNKMLKFKDSGKEFNFFHFMIDLSGGPCVTKRLSGCGSGTEYLAVTPWGDLYPCHQFVGIDKYKMGNVNEGVTNNEVRDDFKNCHVYTKNKCKECWARFYCSGGCNANSYNFYNNIYDVYEIGCELQKKRVECAIYLKAKELLD